MNNKPSSLGYILTSVVVSMIIVSGIVITLQSPYTGIHFSSQDGKWYISSVDTGSPASASPLIVGQQVVSIGDMDMNDYDLTNDLDSITTWQYLTGYWSAHDYLWQYIRVGSPVTITLIKDKKKSTISITPTNLPLSVLLYKLLIPLFIGFLHLFIGLLVVLKKRKELYARLVFGAFILGGSMQILMGLIYLSDISVHPIFLRFVYIANAFENIFATAFTLHFLTLFPRDTHNLSQKRWLIFAFYGITTLVYILYVTRIFYPAFPFFMILSIFTAIYFMVKNYKNSNPIEKGQIRWLYIGIGIFILAVLFLGYLPLLFFWHMLITEQTGSLFTVLFPLSMLFSIVRYRLMDITSLFDNTMVYGITLGGLALIDIGVVSTFMSMGILTAATTPVVIAVSVWAIALSYVWIRGRVHHMIQVLLQREIYDQNEVSYIVSKKLFDAMTIEEAYRVVADEIGKVLHPLSTSAYVYHNEMETPMWEGVPRDNIPVTPELAASLRTANNIYLILDEDYPLPDNYAGGAVIPVVIQNNVAGYIFLQNKRSGRLYDSNNMKLFNLLSNQLAMAVEAITAREEILRKEKEAILEKERLSREIHDGIGSRFIEASMISDQIVRDSGKSDKVARYGKSMKNILLDGLSDLRELIWAVEPGPSNLNAVVAHVKDKIQNLGDRDNFTVRSEIIIENEAKPISAIMKLNLIRVIQESLTNTIKHAKATAMDFYMTQNGDDLFIRVKDNGIGFNADNLKKSGHGIRNIKKRCGDMGGRLEIDSVPGEGTTVSIYLKILPE